MTRHLYEPGLVGRDWTSYSLARIGFFDDGLAADELESRLSDTRWITPTHHLAPKGVVLVTTGAFSPFHEGHLRMLQIARTQIEDQGREVAGAYVIPDHDAYVSAKAGGAAACPASERIHLARVALQGHSWVQVDPWAALYQDRPLNYTTILERTRRLLGPSYEVVYVFGSDNAGFTEAFAPGECVCVGRPGHGEAHPKALNLSSTHVRDQYDWRMGMGTPTPGCPYLIRGDWEWGAQGWGASRDATSGFMIDLLTIYDQLGYHPSTLDLDHQVRTVAALTEPHVSFDRVTGAQHWVSRVFHPCALQERPARWLSSGLAAIPRGRYALVDDDIASRSTVAFIRAATPQVEWTREISLAQLSLPGPHFDIVDARDFLFGARLGGLCIDTGTLVTRAPYVTPWVDLTSRAKIPPAAQPTFVRAIIEANVRFFTQVPVTVAQTDNAPFWQHLGFGLDTTMRAVAESLLTWSPL